MTQQLVQQQPQAAVDYASDGNSSSSSSSQSSSSLTSTSTFSASSSSSLSSSWANDSSTNSNSSLEFPDPSPKPDPGSRNPRGAYRLTLNNVHVDADRNHNIHILRALSGASCGRVMAVVGTSGAGKSTLISLLAMRLRGVSVTHGEVLINGCQFDRRAIKALSGTVMRDDVMFPELTVVETLRFAAKMRMDPRLSDEEREARVQRVISMLALERCQNTIVGDSLKKGISGGERKRLAVGVELLHVPKLLFMDEPTTGLDSVVALRLAVLLRDLTRSEGVTVVISIQQPTADIFRQFDDLLVLHRGTPIYFGEASRAGQFMASHGFPCPPDTTMTDHVLDVITAIESGQSIEAVEQMAKSGPRAPAPEPDDDLSPEDEHRRELAERKAEVERDIQAYHRLGWGAQFAALFGRSFKAQVRGWPMIAVQVAQSAFMGLLTGLVFYSIPTVSTSIPEWRAVVFFCCVNQAIFGPLLMANSFPSERSIVHRERQAGTYNASAYFLAKMLAELIIRLLYPTAFTLCVYFLVGFTWDAAHFFAMLGFLHLCSLVAVSLALAVATVARTVKLTMFLLPVFLETFRLFGGFFLSPADIPVGFRFLDAISFFKYTYLGIVQLELTGKTFTCPPGVATCDTTGEAMIRRLGLDQHSPGECAIILVAMAVFYRIVAYLGLRFRQQ